MNNAPMTTKLADIARGQFGLVSRAQALKVVTPNQLRHLLATRRLEPVRRGVYRAAGAPENWHQQLLAACLACPRAVASFTAAAALWMLQGHVEPDALELTVPDARRVRLDGVMVHESKVWSSSDVTQKHGIPVTSVARTLCDLTAVSEPRAVELALDDALRRKLVTLADVRRVATALDTQGRRRGTVVRALLADRQPGFDPGGSPQEVRLAKLLVGAGLPAPVAQHTFPIAGRRYRVDLAYPDQGVVIEYDGWDFHTGHGVFHGDRARGNELELLGLTVLRFTSKSSDELVVAQVREALTRRGWRAA